MEYYNNYATNGGYAYNYGYPGYTPQNQMFVGAPMNYTPVQMPQNVNALTEEEINTLKSINPSKLDINIPNEEVLRSMCTHKHNGRDVVQLINDGTGDVYCPICQVRWNPTKLSKEEMVDLTKRLFNQIQNMKWVGDLNTSLVRDLFTITPLIMKLPDISDYAMQNFNKYYNQNGYNYSDEAKIYAQYNNLMGYTPQTNYYQNPYQVQPNYYGQGQAPYTQAPYGQTATTVNPMQVTYGVNQQAPNQQFVNQADAMMGGSVYNNPYATAPQQPVSYTPNNYAPVQPGVNQAVTNTSNDGNVTTTETTVNL